MAEDLLGGGDHTPELDQNKNYLSELVGEGKKFKTPEDLAKGKAESDLYIATLLRKQEADRAEYLRLREETTAQAKLKELIDQLETRTKLPNSENTPPVIPVKDRPPSDPEEIDKKIAAKITAFEAAKLEQNNLNIFKGKLKEQFGTNETALNQQIESLGLTKEDVISLAKKSPNAAFKTLGLDEPATKQDFQSPPRSSQRSDNFAPKGGEKRSWSYYQKLRKADPKAYNDPKTTVQMHKDYETLGKEFEDGDFAKFG